MSYSTWNSAPSSSLAMVPRLSSLSKNIQFEVCVNYQDRNHTKYVNISESKKIKELKWAITDKLDLNINSHDICLTMYDENEGTWKSISESPHIAIVDSSLIANSILNVENIENIKTNEQQRPTVDKSKLTLRLCEQPMCRFRYIDITVYSTVTLGELKAQAREKVTNQRTDSLFLWSNKTWITFEIELDDVPLAGLGFENYSFISFQSKDTPVPGVCGLTNLGSTCFMNSALQCLSNIPDLTKKILSLDNNEMNAPILGAYSKLVKTLWSGEQFVITPSTLLRNVCQNLPRFTQYRQHDAHEFMNHFLNIIHQELTNERTLITDLFYGQLRSTVQCLGECHSPEINEERMSFLPLPIDNDVNQHNILYLRSNGEYRFVSIRGHMKTLGDLIQSFIHQYEPTLSSKQIKAVRISDNYIREEYWPTTRLNGIDIHQIALIEVPEKNVEEKYIEFQFRDRKTYKPFRPPVFLVCPSYECRYSHLSEQIDRIRSYLRSAVVMPNTVYHLYLAGTDCKMYELNAEKLGNENILFMNRVVLEMDSEWIQEYTKHYNFEQSSDTVSLTSLLADFFREEPLTGDYYCSYCQGLKQAKQKADLALPLPRVMIIQLKRFTYDPYSNDKIDTYIDFPIRDLDLGTYVAQDDQRNSKITALYDLVAVSNHSGSLISGHYTTYAKNYRNKLWYSFNDDITREITDEKDVVTKNAYILVYIQKSMS